MSKEETAGSKGFLSSALLVAAVAVVMLAGMFLRTDPVETLPKPTAEPPPAEALPLGAAVAPEVQPLLPPTVPVEEPTPEEPDAPPAIDPLISKLAARAEEDCNRLEKARGRWTAQLLVACKPETVDRVLANARGSRELYLLPVHVKDDACFRVCFGTYATAKEAAAAVNLPAALRGKDRIGAVEVVKVLP